MIQNSTSWWLGALLAVAGCSHAPKDLPSTPPKCDIPECFRAVNCVEECGGPILSSSCCPCPDGTFDDITCRGAAGAAGTQ